MFDLFRSRQKSVRILLGVLLGMVALSMLVYLIPGAGTPTGTRDDQVIADIGKQVLTVHDVDVQVQAAIRGRQLPPDLLKVVIPQKVEQMTAERALSYEAQRLGFVVTEQDLAETIRSFGPQITSLSPQQYRDWVEQQSGESVAEFEGNIRLALYGQALEQFTIQGVVAPPAQVEAEYRRRNEKAKLDYIAFDPEKLGQLVKPTAAELQAYFNRNPGFFGVPESRSAQLLIADKAKIAESMQVSAIQIQSYYNTHKDQYRTPERVKARHILVMTMNKPVTDVPKLKAKAEDLLKQVKAGADFAKLAEKSSEDTQSASKGGDLGWIVHGQMVAEFDKATFALQPNEISNVITTPYGFHIIQVLEKEPARLRSMEEAKGEIVAAVKSQNMSERMQTLADQARAELVKAPQNAQQIATRLNLLFVSVDKYKTGDAIPQAPDPQIGATIASMQKGTVSEVLQSADKLVIATVTNVFPPHSGQFDEVESQVRSRYAQEKGNQLMAEKSKKAGDLVRANGGDLKAAAKSVGLEVKTTDAFGRNGAAEGIGSAAYLGDAFDKPVGTLIGPLNVGTQNVVAKIVEKIAADMSKLPEERESIVTQLKQKKGIERQALLRDSILTQLIQQGKVKIHRDVVNRLVARYRSSS